MTNKEVINFLNQVRKILLDDKSWLESTIQPINEAFDMAIDALTAQSEAHADLIDRQALMKEFADFVRRSNNSDFAPTPTWNDAVSLVGSMPPVQPSSSCAHENDSISRQAALKASRIMRGENPTPVNIREAESKLVEEWTDLCLVADVMGMNLDEDIYDGKLNRWTARLNEVRNDSKGISSAT